MCELLGFSSFEKRNIKSFLKEFFTHSNSNPNGWGLAEFSGDSVRFNTEAVSADKSSFLPKLIEDNISSYTVMAHIRRATVGEVDIRNCHPFIGVDSSKRKWYLMHNGTVFSGTELIGHREKQDGTTDSQRILLYLIDSINAETKKKGTQLNPFERFRVVERAIETLSYRNKLNLIIYDGEQMYVHCNMDGTLFYKEEQGGIIFATVPLDNELWSPVPLTTLFVYQNGRLRYKGKNHRNEFVEAMGVVTQNLDYNI